MVVNMELLSRADGVGHYETETESPSSTNPGAVKITGMFQVAWLKKIRPMEAACKILRCPHRRGLPRHGSVVGSPVATRIFKRSQDSRT